MLAKSLLVVLSGLLAAIEAGKGHPVGYNYCTPGLTRPKQPKPPTYQAPKKPVGIDFPPGKPAPVPLDPRALHIVQGPTSPLTQPQPPPQVVKPKPESKGSVPLPKTESGSGTPKQTPSSPKNKPTDKSPPPTTGSSDEHPKKHSAKHQHKHQNSGSDEKPCDKNKPKPGGKA